jgi:hypothetical protein
MPWDKVLLSKEPRSGAPPQAKLRGYIFFPILGSMKFISSKCISVSFVYMRYLYAALEKKGHVTK